MEKGELSKLHEGRENLEEGRDYKYSVRKRLRETALVSRGK